MKTCQDFFFVNTDDNVITRVTAAAEDDAWVRYIKHYYGHRLTQYGESYATTRHDLEHSIYVVAAGNIKHIGVL